MNTLHGFADTVRFRRRGLIVDRAKTIGHNRIFRGGPLMLFMCILCPHADRQFSCLPSRLLGDISRTRGAI